MIDFTQIVSENSRHYRIAYLPKGRGRFREIYIALGEYAGRLKSYLPNLNLLHDQLDDCGVGYAFRKGRNCALMAIQHVGRRHLLSMDLEGFFESVTADHLANLVPSNYLDECLIDGRLRQGLATSPVLANIAFLNCDRAILRALRQLKLDVTYTRYADDLVFSFDDPGCSGKIQTVVRQIVNRAHFEINERKTKNQSGAGGRLIVVGIAVDGNGLHATRRTRRKIRAALHQNNHPAVKGLEEWARCQLPLSFIAPELA